MYSNIKSIVAIMIITMLLLFSTWSLAKPADYGDIVGSTFVRAYDGDTMTVNIPNTLPIIGDEISVRIKHIDTPEIYGKCQAEKDAAHAARDAVIAMIGKCSVITLHHVERDKYFRILAEVDIDGLDVGSSLIKRGLAVQYEGGTKTHSWCP